MSLTSCLRKAGDALPMRDSAAIMASALKYRATGMDANAAAQQAVSDRLGTVRTEIAQAATAAVNQGQDNEVRGTFSPSSNTITLLKKANLSTFAHETGHLYLEILSDLASQEGAPAEIVEDMGKVLKWFGIKGTEQLDGGAQDGALEQRAVDDVAAELLVQHNLSAENLLHAQRMGGIPVPSLAVTKKSAPMDSFGEITLIGSKEMADPKGYAGTKVFGADIYSPRYPSVEFKLDNKAQRAFNAALDKFRQDGDREMYGSEIRRPDDVTSYKPFKRWAADRYGITESGLTWQQLKESAAALMREIGAGERIFQGFTYSGNRRYIDHTLDNVVKILKKGLRGGENFNYGVGSLRAKFTPQFRSIEHIRKAKGRLLDKASFEAIKKEVNDEFIALSEDLDLSLEQMTEVIEDSAKMGAKRAINRAFKDYKRAEYESTDEQAIAVGDFARKLVNLPTEYFEAKILRAVDLAEFSAAVVPADAPQEVLNALAERGVKRVATYDPKVDGDRAAKIGEFNDLFFQDGPTADATPVTPKRTPLETWNSMPLEQKRPFHEQFARGWEGYLFEGKSPSTGLSKVFRRFSQWMLQIYKTIKNLAAPLNADMRGVFDRLVASEEEIKAAELERQMAPLFADAKAAGMTEEEFAAYQALGQESQDDAIEQLGLRSVRDMKWLSNARDRLLRQFQATAAKERKAIREEVTAEVDAQPVEQARVELQKLAEADPQTKQAITDWKARKKQQEVADLAAVRAEYLDQQPDLVGLAKGQFLAKNKREIDLEAARRTLQWERENPAPDRPSNPISLDAVATQFGFEDGAALGRALIESPRRGDLIDAMTDQRMMERHGDLINQSAVDAAVNEALHNEARARFVATELAALDKAVGKPRVMMDAARRFAAELIGRKLIKDVRPSVFQTAETRAAAEAAGTKDITVRVAAKRAQLFNHYAVKEATNALEEVDRGIKYLRKLETSESIDPEYKEQIDALLAGFDLRASTSNKQIKRTQSLGAWVEAQREMGIEPDIPEALLLETERGSYKALTVDEFRGLVDAVRQIEHLGRLKHKLLMAKDAKEIAAIREEMAAGIIANGGKPRPVKLEGQSGPAKLWDGFTAAHRKLSSLFRQMDGGKDNGPMWQFIGRTMNERGTWEDSRIERATVELRKLYDKVTALPGGVSGWRSKIHIKEIDASMTRGGRLAVALNWGNEDNRQRLLGNYEGGNHWSESQVRAIMKTLTPDELAFVNGVWAHLDSYWPEIADKQKRLTGKEPERVAPAPFTVTAADGTEVMMSGGYYPLKYDQERSVRASNQDQQQLAKDMMRGAVTSSTTRRGHTKERVQEVKRPVRLDLNVITEHVGQVVHDLAWHEWLIDTNRLLKSDDVSGAISSHYGMEAYKTIQKGLEDIASGGLERSTAIDAVLLQVRSNITRATMGASLTTAFLQPFGLTQSAVRIGPKHVMRGAARWAGDAMQMENTLGWIQDKSEFMRLRSKAFNRELREIRGTVKGKSKTMQVIDTGLFLMMQKMQLIADVPTWVGQYEKTKEIGAEYKAALARGLDEAEAAAEQESAAVSMADRAVMEAQGGGHIKDLSEVQRKHPMLTQFYSYFNVTLNLAAESTAATDFKNPRAVAGWLGDMALLMVIPSILPALLMHLIKSGGAGDDEPEEWVKRVAKWQAGYLLGLTVGLREGSGLLEGFDYAGPPVGRLVGDVGKFGKQLAQGEMDEAAVLASINLMGSAFGIPVVQASRSYKGWKAWDEGKEGAGPQSVLFGPPPRN